MQTYEVGDMMMVVNEANMVPVGTVLDTTTDLLIQFGDVSLRYDRRLGAISGSGFVLEYSPERDPLSTVVHLVERGKKLADMRILAVLRPQRTLH